MAILEQDPVPDELQVQRGQFLRQAAAESRHAQTFETPNDTDRQLDPAIRT